MPDVELHEKVDLILLVLRGNGNPQNGLVTKHEVLTHKVEDHIANHGEIKRDGRWLAATLISIGCLVVAIVAIFK